MTIECDDGIQLIFRTFLNSSAIVDYYQDSGNNFLDNLGTHLVGVGSSYENISEMTLYIVPYGRAPSASKAGDWAIDGSLYISSLCRNVSSPGGASNNSVEIYGSNYYVLPFFRCPARLSTYGWSRFLPPSGNTGDYDLYKVKVRFNNYTNTFVDNFGISIVPGNINTDYQSYVCPGRVDDMCDNLYVNYHYISSFQNEDTYLQWQQYFYNPAPQSNSWSTVTSWYDLQTVVEIYNLSHISAIRQIRQTAYNPYLKFRELYKKGVNSSKEKQLRALISGTRTYASNGGGFCAFYKEAGGDSSLGASYKCFQAPQFFEGSGRTSLLVKNDSKSLLVGSINEVSENSNFIPFSLQNGTLSSSYFIEY